MITQVPLRLPPFSRGFHLITDLIEQALPPLPAQGLLHIFLAHTSAALSLNENADPSVRQDLDKFSDHLVPANSPLYTHIYEGPDDMPAHIKSSLFGAALTIPIRAQRLFLGTWQGIYLCEFRERGGSRHLLLTIYS